MKWFKHISDSLDDPFIFDLIDRFGGDGYLVFFGVLEVYSREFKTELNWKLNVTQAYLNQKLHKRQATLVIKILKHIQNSGKWEIEFNDGQVIIFIPKFTQLIDEWTKRKLGSSSGVTPKILKPEVEVEVDKYNYSVPIKKIIDLFNACIDNNNSKISKVIKINKNTDRHKHLQARWKESPDIETFKTVFDNITKSNFCNGKNDRLWKADFDWVVKSGNFIKALENKYNNKPKASGVPIN